MEREIYEQPSVLKELLETYISNDNKILLEVPEKIEKICFVASGSSYHCGVIAADMVKHSLGIDSEVSYSGEFYLSEKANLENRLFIFVSQSGETSDTLKVMNEILKKTDNTLCITNTKDSTMWNLAKYKIYTMAGVENSIASTKALAAQLLCAVLIILAVKQKAGENIDTDIQSLKSLPEVIEKLLNSHEFIKDTAKNLVNYDTIEILGSRMFYGLAKEGSLKIKETSYINTTAFPTGEFMHGHVAVLNHKSAVIMLVDQINHGLCITNIQKIKESYSPYLVTISDKNAPEYLNEVSENNISLDTKDEIHTVFAMLVLLQVLAFNCATLLGRNIDKPIGLCKVVK